MDTASKTPHEARATDRVLEALSTIAAMLDSSITEVKSLDSEFQNRVLQAVHETEASLEDQFKARLAELSTQWESERERLNAELTGITQTRAQWEAERARLNRE